MKWYAVVVCGNTYWVHAECASAALEEARRQMKDYELIADYAVYECAPKIFGIQGSPFLFF